MVKRIIRVLIVDDNVAVRRSIMAMLAGEQDIEVVDTAVDGHEAIQVAQTTNPDVIVMDVSMPGMDGIRATSKIKALGLPAQIIILSMHYDNILVEQARKSGASGYITKQQANTDLIPAIRGAAAGNLSL